MTMIVAMDVVLIQETWLKETDGSVFHQINEFGYKTLSYRKPRNSGFGGGVAVFYKDKLNVSKVKGMTYRSFEYLSVDIKLFHRSVRVINIYTSPYSQRNKITIKSF